MNKERRSALIIGGISAVVTVGVILLYMYLLKYVSPAADDYSNANSLNGMIDLCNGSKLLGVLRQTQLIYENNQGTWVSMLYLYTVEAAFGLAIWPYRISLLIAMITFFGGMIVFWYSLSDRMLNIGTSIPFFLIILIVSMEHASPSETLFWLTGAAVYTFPGGLGLISMALYLLDCKKKNTALMIVACVLGFLGTGGVLVYSGFMNIIIVMFILWQWGNDRHFPVRSLIYLASILAGALFNTLAPGNFVRHGGELNIAGALKNTVAMLHWQWGQMATETYYLAGLCIAVILTVILTKRSESEKHYKLSPILIAFAGYIICYVTLFPAVLGYDYDPENKYIEIRLAFTMAWIISFVSILFVVYTVGYFCERLPKRKAMGIAAIAIFAVLGVIASISEANTISQTELSETYVARVFEELESGKMKANYEGMQILRYKCETMPDDFVMYDADIPISKILKHQLLSSDPSWWINQSIAWYYGNTGLAYCPPEQT